MNYEETVFYNGEFLKMGAYEELFPIEERGVQFGDGVYEVFRIYDGNIYTLKEHTDRLYRSLAAVRMVLPWDKWNFERLLRKLVAENEFQGDGQLYLQVTRGTAPRNHVFPQGVTPNIVGYVKKAARPLETMRSGVSVYTEDDIRWLRCDIKSLNLLPNVLAKQAAKEKGGYEALLHRDGVVTECSSANVFLVIGKSVITHPSNHLVLNGITRQRIQALCEKNGLHFLEEAFTLEDVEERAEELFLSSTTSEITPIVRVDDKPVGDGAVGEVTRKLQGWYEEDAGIAGRNERIGN